MRIDSTTKGIYVYTLFALSYTLYREYKIDNTKIYTFNELDYDYLKNYKTGHVDKTNYHKHYRKIIIKN